MYLKYRLFSKITLDKKRSSRTITAFLNSLLLLMQGCTVYHEKPLQQLPHASSTISQLITTNKELAEVKSINISDGINLQELATIAVFVNPDLRIKHDSVRVSQAQSFSAGLLPDPQFSYAQDKPDDKAPGLVNAFSKSVDFDITTLLNWSANRKTGILEVQQKKLELLWAEWQVIQHVQILALQYVNELDQLKLIKHSTFELKTRYENSRNQLEKGNVTLEINAIDLTAYLDVQHMLFQLQQTHTSTRESLCLALSLSPACDLSILNINTFATVNDNIIQAHVNNIQSIRPDLLALKAGYLAQEKRLKSSVLSQFPRINIGITRTRDTSALYTSGYSIGITLPIFNRNRGQIAIERATRLQLQTEYYSRLSQVRSEVVQLIDLQKLIQLQIDTMQSILPDLETSTEKARRAYLYGEIDPLIYLNMETSLLNKRLERINLQQQASDIQISLTTLLMIPTYLNQVHYSTDHQNG